MEHKAFRERVEIPFRDACSSHKTKGLYHCLIDGVGTLVLKNKREQYTIFEWGRNLWQHKTEGDGRWHVKEI